MVVGLPLWGWILGGIGLVAVIVVVLGIAFYPRDNSF